MKERRRWARIAVVDNKLICRITESKRPVSGADFIIHNINAGGLSFFSQQEIAGDIHLLIKFPFTSFEDAGSVWGRVVYNQNLGEKEKYLVGVSFIRKKTKAAIK
jgi:hypothetical protein